MDNTEIIGTIAQTLAEHGKFTGVMTACGLMAGGPAGAATLAPVGIVADALYAFLRSSDNDEDENED